MLSIVDALPSGFRLFWLGSSWQRAFHVPYHHWRWQKDSVVLLSFYAHTENRVTCDWFQWHFNVVFNEVDLNHNFAASLFFFFIFESFCLFALNKHVLFEVEVILQLINSLCLCSHLVIDFESHSILYINLKKCMQIGNSSKCLHCKHLPLCWTNFSAVDLTNFTTMFIAQSTVIILYHLCHYNWEPGPPDWAFQSIVVWCSCLPIKLN